MRTIRLRERTATPEELEDERQRWLRAKSKPKDPNPNDPTTIHATHGKNGRPELPTVQR
jgi:hypothetical protein